MSVLFKRSLAFIVGAVAALSVVCTLLWLLWLRDVQNDRKHTVSVNAATPVFVGSGSDGGCYGAQLTTIQQGAKLVTSWEDIIEELPTDIRAELFPVEATTTAERANGFADREPKHD